MGVRKSCTATNREQAVRSVLHLFWNAAANCLGSDRFIDAHRVIVSLSYQAHHQAACPLQASQSATHLPLQLLLLLIFNSSTRNDSRCVISPANLKIFMLP